MKKTKRWMSWALALAMVLGMLPAVTTPASAAETEALPDRDKTSLGLYTNSVQVGERYVINGGLNSDSLSGRLDPYGKISKNSNGASSNLFDDILVYNMFQNFSNNTSGFTVGSYVNGSNGNRMINSGMTNDNAHDPRSITVGTRDGDDDGSITVTVNINNNPTLKKMAEGGELEYYFSGFVCGAKTTKKVLGIDALGKDKHTNVTVKVESPDYSQSVSSGKSGSHESSISTGWKSIGTGGTINITVSFSGNSDKRCGLCDGVLLFRVKTQPKLKTYDLYAEGNYRASDSYMNGSVVFLKQNSKIGLNLKFEYEDGKPAYVFPTMMGQHIKQADSYKLLSQLANHQLFSNAMGTGELNQGEPVYLRLVSLDREIKSVSGSSDGIRYALGSERNQADGADLMVKAAENGTGFSSMQYVWTCSETDFNNNQPFLNGADWSGLKPTNNNYSFMTKLYYASLHDLAGSPLMIEGKTSYAMTETDYPKLGGTVQVNNVNNGTEKTIKSQGTSANPEYDPFGWTNYVADGILPKYTLTANGVQPDILTKLALNAGDSFEVYLNFYEGVQSRKFNADGSESYLRDDNTELVFKNGLVGTYMAPVSDKLTPGGSRQWRFKVTIPEGTSVEVTGANNFLEVDYLRNAGNTGEAVLTDYVGNQMTAANATLGSAYNRRMAWAELQIDNTLPTLSISNNLEITVTDAGVGAYRPKNTTSNTESSGGLAYYTWVRIPEEELTAGTKVEVMPPDGTNNKIQVYPSVKTALETLAGNTSTGKYSYAAVKLYSLTGTSPSGYSILPANTGSIIAMPNDPGNYCLLAFAPDMTWDSARQLIEYDQYRATFESETGATAFFARIAGDAVAANAYEAATTDDGIDNWKAANNWTQKYTNFYIKEGNSYRTIPTMPSYPAWEANKYYASGYSELTGAEKEWNNWKQHYTEYFVKNGSAYNQLAKVDPIPVWAANKYYKEYQISDSASAPSGFPTDYYEASESSYIPVGIPTFTSGSVYTLSASSSFTVSGSESDYAKVNSVPDGVTKYYKAKSTVAGADPTTITSTMPKKTNPEHATDPTKPEKIDCTSNDVDLYVKWSDVRKSYYKKDGDNYYVTADPENVTYYTVSQTALSSEPSNWTTYWWDHQTGNTTYYTWRADNETPGNVSKFTVEGYEPYSGEFAANTYYQLNDSDAYELLASQPSDWGTGDYYQKVALPTGFVTMGTSATYMKSVYYKYVGTGSAIASSAKPSDWDYDYTEYKVMNGGSLVNVTTVEAPEIDSGKEYYKYGYYLAPQPANWADVWKEYYVKDGDSYKPTASAGLALGDNPPEVTADGSGNVLAKIDGSNQQVYMPSASLGALANEVFYNKDAQTVADKEAFLKEIVACSTYLERVNVVMSYQEFNDKVYQATQDSLINSRNYESWGGYYEKIDSNWTFGISAGQDKQPPYLSGTASVANDNTKNPQVAFTMRDDTSITHLFYKFVAAGSAAPDETAMKNNIVNCDSLISSSSASVTAELNKATDYTGFTAGSYDLYVYAEDGAANSTILKLATVQYNPAYDTSTVTATISSAKLDAGNAVRTLDDVRLTIAGAYQNAQPYASLSTAAKIYYAISDGTDSASITSWTEFPVNSTGAAVGEVGANGMIPYTATLPAFGNVNGTRYVHVKLEYSGMTGTFHSAACQFDNTAPTVSVNTTSNSGTSVTLSVVTQDTPAGVASVQYQWIVGDTQPAAEDGNWLTLPSSGSVSYTRKNNETSVKLWYKATDTLGNTRIESKSVALNAAAAVEPGNAPTPSKALLAVTDMSSVIELTLDKDKITENTEYSYALVDSGDVDALTDESELKWSRWMPFESIVSVGVGKSSGKSILLRFRDGGGEPTALAVSKSDYCVSTSETPNGGDYVTVSRSTLNSAGSVTLVFSGFVDKGGATLTTDTLTANGVYEYTLGQKAIYVAVGNIISSPPTFTMSYSTQRRTAGSVGVTVVPDAQSKVIDVKFTPAAGGAAQTAAPGNLYTFTENGTVVFTLDNGYRPNNVPEYTEAMATVSWIEKEGPTVAASVTRWPEANASLSAGAYITLTAASKFNVSKTPGGVRWLEPTEPEGASADWNRMTVVEDSYYDRDGNMQEVIKTVTGLKEYEYFVEENGTYGFTVMNELGATRLVRVEVNSIVKPFVMDGEATVQEDGVSIQVTGKLYGKAQGNEIECPGMTATYGATQDGATAFTLTRKFGSNSSGTMTVTDTAGHSATFSYAVTSVDLEKPSIALTAPAKVRMSDDLTAMGVFELQTLTYENGSWTGLNNFWKNLVDVSDNNAKDGATMTFRAELLTSGAITRNGSYALRLTARDQAGNIRTKTGNLMVMPENAMMVSDEDSVLFYSGSSDVALVEDNEITLTITDYNLMRYGASQQVIRNKKATVEVFIMSGLYREGQMKQLLGKLNVDTTKGHGTLTLNGETGVATLTISKDYLTKTGWYTIIVRNGEREREYTTFFIQSLK